MRPWWHWGLHGRHTGGNCPRWHSSGLPPSRSTIAQSHSGSVPGPASAVAFEVEKCWQLRGADVVAVVPLEAGRDVWGAVGPKQQKSNKGKVRIYSNGRRL